jgi:hypothetical protein
MMRGSGESGVEPAVMTVSRPVVAHNRPLPLGTLRLVTGDGIAPPEFTKLVIKEIGITPAPESFDPYINRFNDSAIWVNNREPRNSSVTYDLAASYGIYLTVHYPPLLVVIDRDDFLPRLRMS